MSLFGKFLYAVVGGEAINLIQIAVLLYHIESLCTYTTSTTENTYLFFLLFFFHNNVGLVKIHKTIRKIVINSLLLYINAFDKSFVGWDKSIFAIGSFYLKENIDS